MAETDAEQEPTMEEILASIRRIISEDEEAPADEAAGADEADAVSEPAPEPEPEPAAEPEPVAAAPEPEPEPVVEPEPEEVLELTELAEPEEDGDLVIFEEEPEPEPAPEPVAAPEPVQVAAPVEPTVDEDLVADEVATAAASSFGDLLNNMMIAQAPGAGLTLEGLVRELLKPMLKEWLDANLQDIVDARVKAEIAKIADRAVR